MAILGSVIGCPDCDLLAPQGKACGAHGAHMPWCDRKHGDDLSCAGHLTKQQKPAAAADKCPVCGAVNDPECAEEGHWWAP